MDFYELQVQEVRTLHEDAVQVIFDVPEELAERYHHIPGQYITIEHLVAGDKIRRSYSICSHPSEPLSIGIKRIPEGLFSTYAVTELKAGDRLSVALPMGQFTHEADASSKECYVAFAAGSGITPILSMLKTTLLEQPNASFVLFYGNRTSQDIMFKEELEGLKNEHMERLQIHYVLSREEVDAPLLSGRIQASRCEDYIKYLVGNQSIGRVYLCGPYDMIMSMKTALADLGIEEQQLGFELFFNPETALTKDTDDEVQSLEAPRRIRVTLDGTTTEIDVHTDQDVLQVASDAGLDLPYSCKGGVCATCKAKVLEGDANMKINFALEEDEVEDGYVLTCQTYINSDFVHVDFDS